MLKKITVIVCAVLMLLAMVLPASGEVKYLQESIC